MLAAVVLVTGTPARFRDTVCHCAPEPVLCRSSQNGVRGSSGSLSWDLHPPRSPEVSVPSSVTRSVGMTSSRCRLSTIRSCPGFVGHILTARCPPGPPVSWPCSCSGPAACPVEPAQPCTGGRGLGRRSEAFCPARAPGLCGPRAQGRWPDSSLPDLVWVRAPRAVARSSLRDAGGGGRPGPDVGHLCDVSRAGLPTSSAASSLGSSLSSWRRCRTRRCSSR